jgi:hypothetical protein
MTALLCWLNTFCLLATIALGRSSPRGGLVWPLRYDEKCDGRDQDGAREKHLKADDGGLLRRLLGLIVGLLDHCTFLV